MEPLLLAIVVALALLVLLRRPGALSPVPLAVGVSRRPGAPAPGDDEEQLPETDRAPQRWLPWGIAAVALFRVVLLVTMGA